MNAMAIRNEIRSAPEITFIIRFRHHHLILPQRAARAGVSIPTSVPSAADSGVRAYGSEAGKLPNKPAICTADELHYVSVGGSDWKLALWRYTPSPLAPPRNHPLLLLSGVGTNAIGYDLSPGISSLIFVLLSSFARYMCGQGFDTWILEVRGIGLSMRGLGSQKIEHSVHAISEELEATTRNANRGVFLEAQQASVVQRDSAESKIAAEGYDLKTSKGQSRITSAKLFNEAKRKLSSSLDSRHGSSADNQISELSQKLVNAIDDGQRSVSPKLFNWQERLAMSIEDFCKQLDSVVKYDWDFDHYLEEDVPAAMKYIKDQANPKDGKMLAIGHSMGGILLYALMSQCGSEGRESGLAAIVTLASSLDYGSSKSYLKKLLPLADPAHALNVPAVPLGAFLSAAYPLSSLPPYVLSWLNEFISAQDMIRPELLKKLVLNSFCAIPTKLIMQLRTAFQEGGLYDRTGTFSYKDHLHNARVPVLALAGDGDLICPFDAVLDTVKLIPEHLVTYRVFGEPNGQHYAHYDLIGGRLAVDQVYPCIVQFLSLYDST